MKSCGGLIRLLSDIDYRSKFFFNSCHNFDKHLRYSGELPPDVKGILDMILSMDTETLQLILNIRLLFDENTGHSREQDRYTLTQGNAATLIYSSMLFDLPYINAENSKYRRLKLPKNILILAAAGGLLQAVQQLIESGYPADERAEEGITALYHASARSFSEICILLTKFLLI